ncbi:unnamed protein product [Toxocara canis]|uniref:CC domain-containing protein n=1 Tax=Toxocara canis TaxID=6265 RepID=A0A183UAA4_TOXCA|nr:unnamed protein product [Toxocara canis]
MLYQCSVAVRTASRLQQLWSSDASQLNTATTLTRFSVQQQPCASECEQPCTSGCPEQTSPCCCVDVQLQVDQSVGSSCCTQQYQQCCQCVSVESCCAQQSLPSSSLPPTTPPTTTTTTTYSPPPPPPPQPSCVSCSAVQPAYHVNVVLQCVPACQPSCQPSCTAQPVSIQSQYNMATTSCGAQVINTLTRYSQSIFSQVNSPLSSSLLNKNEELYVEVNKCINRYRVNYTKKINRREVSLGDISQIKIA